MTPEAGPDVSVRLAWPDDATAIATIAVAAWRHDAIAGEAVLEALDPSGLADRWRALLTRPPEARVRVLVALERASVRGVALVHPSADGDADPIADGEIGELLVDPGHRGQGHGSRLLQACADTLSADRFTRARWWLPTEADDLRRFVTDSGWAPDGAHRELAADSGETIRQVRLHTALS